MSVEKISTTEINGEQVATYQWGWTEWKSRPTRISPTEYDRVDLDDQVLLRGHGSFAPFSPSSTNANPEDDDRAVFQNIASQFQFFKLAEAEITWLPLGFSLSAREGANDPGYSRELAFDEGDYIFGLQQSVWPEKYFPQEATTGGHHSFIRPEWFPGVVKKMYGPPTIGATSGKPSPTVVRNSYTAGGSSWMVPAILPRTDNDQTRFLQYTNVDPIIIKITEPTLRQEVFTKRSDGTTASKTFIPKSEWIPTCDATGNYIQSQWDGYGTETRFHGSLTTKVGQSGALAFNYWFKRSVMLKYMFKEKRAIPYSMPVDAGRKRRRIAYEAEEVVPKSEGTVFEDEGTRSEQDNVPTPWDQAHPGHEDYWRRARAGYDSGLSDLQLTDQELNIRYQRDPARTDASGVQPSIVRISITGRPMSVRVPVVSAVAQGVYAYTAVQTGFNADGYIVFTAASSGLWVDYKQNETYAEWRRRAGLFIFRHPGDV